MNSLHWRNEGKFDISIIWLENVGYFRKLDFKNAFFLFCRQEIFAKERMKLLQQHADEIIGFLPRELIETMSIEY